MIKFRISCAKFLTKIWRETKKSKWFLYTWTILQLETLIEGDNKPYGTWVLIFLDPEYFQCGRLCILVEITLKQRYQLMRFLVSNRLFFCGKILLFRIEKESVFNQVVSNFGKETRTEPVYLAWRCWKEIIGRRTTSLNQKRWYRKMPQPSQFLSVGRVRRNCWPPLLALLHLVSSLGDLPSPWVEE